jgi:hypothetical protein
MEYMVPPIKLCTNGHNICSKCRERVQCCPTCRAKFSDNRNVNLENIVRTREFPCDNRQSGCLDFFSIEHIAEHHAVCVYENIKCPFQIIGKCSWKGIKSDLKEHAKSAHPEGFYESPKFRSSGTSVHFGILSCCGELFTYYQQVRDCRLYGAVQLIGKSREGSRYKSEFTLLAANGIEQICNTFLVRSSKEKFETIFNSGRCLSLEVSKARNFIVKNELNLAIELSRVE